MIDIRAGKDVTGATVGSDTGLQSNSVPAADRGGEGIVAPSASQAATQSTGMQRQEHVAQAAQSREKLDQAISQLRDYVQSLQRDLHFDVHESTGRMVIRVVDRGTQQLVRQIPEGVVLDLAQKLNAEEPLRLFSARA